MLDHPAIYLRAWWPQWLAAVTAGGLVAAVFWGMEIAPLITLSLAAALAGFVVSTFARIACH